MFTRKHSGRLYEQKINCSEAKESSHKSCFFKKTKKKEKISTSEKNNSTERNGEGKLGKQLKQTELYFYSLKCVNRMC